MSTNHNNGNTIMPGTNYRLSLKPHEILVPEGWPEAAITKSVQGKELDASVPLGALGPKRDFLPVKVLWVEEHAIGVVLPVGNDGTQMWSIPTNDFYEMLLGKE